MASQFKYRVFAGSQHEGTVLEGQPYNGALDSESVADFAQQALCHSPYRRSDIAFALADHDWVELESHIFDGEGVVAFYEVYDTRAAYGGFCNQCDGDDAEDDEDNCTCELTSFWVFVEAV